MTCDLETFHITLCKLHIGPWLAFKLVVMSQDPACTFLNWDLTWAQTNSPSSAAECENTRVALHIILFDEAQTSTRTVKDIFWTGEGLQEGFWMKYFYIVVYTCLYVSKAMLPATFTGKDTNTVNYYRVSEHLPGAAPSTGNKRCHFHYSWNLLGLMGPNPPCSLCQPA